MKAAPGSILQGALALALLVFGPASGSPFGPARAEAFDPPALTVSSTLVHAGDIVQLHVSHFVPGGYTATIQFDGANDGTFAVPPGGAAGPIGYTIPLTAAAGAHDLSVCVTCSGGDIEQRSTVRITVTTGALPADRWNASVWGIEITQGVRGDFAMRDPVGGPTTLASEGAVHVADRHTVVRAYPWMEAGALVSPTRTVRAQLGAVIDGVSMSLLDPVEPTLDLRADRTFDELRSDLNLTWNFVLPESWTTLAPLDATKNIDFYVRLTAVSAGECLSCGADNQVFLNDNTFHHVGQSPRHALTFRPFRLQVVPDPDEPDVIEGRPTLVELQSAIASFYEILPIGHAHRGLLLYPWVDTDWTGPLTVGRRQLFDEAMIRRFPAAGRAFDTGFNEVYAFMRGTGSCAGHAYQRRAYMISSSCGWPNYVAAHELSHCIGRGHAGNGHGEDGTDPTYPSAHGQVEANAWGLDTYTGMLVPPTAVNLEFATHDFMSYGPTPQWMSLYSWDRLTADLGSGDITLPAPARGPALASTPANTTPMLVTGTLDANGQIALSSFFGAKPLGQQPAGDLLLHFSDGNGNTLADVTMPVMMPTDPDPLPGGGLFAGIVDVPVGWSQLQVGVGPNPQLTFQRSPSAPAVTLMQPSAPFQWGASGTQLVKWQGSDADNDALTFRVVGQRNGLETHILASDVTGTETTLDLAQLPGGGSWTLTVEASDDFNTGVSQAVQGTVDAHPPKPLIVFPRDGATFVVGDEVTASGLVADFQDESDGSNLTWWLDGTQVGTGASLALPALAVGPHSLEARATNSAQLQGSMTESFFVVAALDVPTLQAPADGAGGAPDPTNLSWTAVPGAASYRVQVAYGPNFSPVLAEFGSVAGGQLEFDGKPGHTYYWRARADHLTASSDWSAPRSFTVASTTGVPAPGAGRPLALRAFPNPIAPGTTLEFALARVGSVEIMIYDVTGRRVCRAFRGALAAGPHSVGWDGRDASGRAVAAGTYLARLVGPDGEGSVRLVKLSN